MADRYLLESGAPDGYLLEDGSGVFIIDMPAIINSANTTVTDLGGDVWRVEKTGGSASTYDADAVGTVGFTGDFVLRLKKVAGAGWYMGGMNADPTSASDLSSIDRAWGQLSDTWTIFENGSVQGTSFLADATYAWIWRTGTSLSYGRGATLVAAQSSPDRTVTDSNTLYFDSTFSNVGEQIEAFLYVPLPPTDITGTSTLSFSSAGTATGAALITGASSLTFAPTGTATGKGALSGASSLTFAPTGAATGKGALTASSTLIFSPASTLTGRVPISGSSTLTFAPTGTATGRGALTGTSPLTFAPSGILSMGGSTGALSGTASLTLSPVATIVGLADLAGTADLSFAPTASMSGMGALLGTSSLSLSGASVLTRFDWNEVSDTPDTWAEQPTSGTWTQQPVNDPDWEAEAATTDTWAEQTSTGTWS